MKLVFVMHYHISSFNADFSKIYDPKKYKLFGLMNQLSYDILIKKEQYPLFNNIFVHESYTFDSLVETIDRVCKNNPHSEISIVTAWEGDVSMCGRLNKHYGLMTENYDRFVDKVLMKQTLRKTDVRLPKYVKFSKEIYKQNPGYYINLVEKNIPYPLFVKPIDQNGSFGTEKINNKEQLLSWASKVSSTNDNFEYEIDEFIEGVMYHCDSFIQNGKIIYTQVARDMHPCYDFVLGKPNGSIVMSESDPINNQIREFSENALTKLGLPKSGITHLELFRKNDGDLVFLEVAYRPGGGWINKMYKSYLNRDIDIDHVMLQIDPEYKINIKYGNYSAWVMYPLEKGVVTRCNHAPVYSESTEVFKVSAGDHITSSIMRLSDVAHIIHINDKNFKTVLEDFELLRNFKPLSLIDKKSYDAATKKPLSFSYDKINNSSIINDIEKQQQEYDGMSNKK